MLFRPTMPTVGSGTGSARGLTTFSSLDSSSSSVLFRVPEALLPLRMPKQDIFWESLSSAVRGLAGAAGAVIVTGAVSVLTGTVSERPEVWMKGEDGWEPVGVVGCS